MSGRNPIVAGLGLGSGKNGSAARAALAAAMLIAATAAAEARSPDFGISNAGATTRAALPEGSIVVAKRGSGFGRGAAMGVAVGSGRAAARERNRNRDDSDADSTEPAATPDNDAPAQSAGSATDTSARPPVMGVTKPAVVPTATTAPIGGHDCFAGCGAPVKVAAPVRQPAALPAAPVAASYDCVAGCGGTGPRNAVADATAPGAQPASANAPSNRITVLRGTSRSKVYGVSN